MKTFVQVLFLLVFVPGVFSADLVHLVQMKELTNPLTVVSISYISTRSARNAPKMDESVQK